jgi:hypothetical protein
MLDLTVSRKARGRIVVCHRNETRDITKTGMRDDQEALV